MKKQEEVNIERHKKRKRDRKIDKEKEGVIYTDIIDIEKVR